MKTSSQTTTFRTTTTTTRTTTTTTRTPARTEGSTPRGAVSSPQSAGSSPRGAASAPRGAASAPRGDGFDPQPAKASGKGRDYQYVSQVEGEPRLEMQRTANGYRWRRSGIPKGMHYGAPKPTNDLRNDSAHAQFAKGGWAQSTPPFSQVDMAGCGPAVVSMLASSKLDERSQTGEVLMEQAGQVSTDGLRGSSPQEMGRMLAQQGLETTGGVGREDKKLLQKMDQAFEDGDKIVALVDSERISEKGGESGTAHWVIIDGKDKIKNEYLVKNPATGKDYYVPAKQLEAAIAGASHKGGGFLSVTGASQASERELLRNNAEHAQVLGKTPGTGSKGGKFAQEASTGTH